MQNTIHDWIMRTPEKYFSPWGIVDKAKKETKELFDATKIFTDNEIKIGCVESSYAAGMKYRQEGNLAIADILLKDIPLTNISQRQTAHQEKLAELNYDVELELGDVFFAICCLSNVYDVSSKETYEHLVQSRKEKSRSKIDSFIAKHIYAALPIHFDNAGRSGSDYEDREYRPNKVLFHRLRNNIEQLEGIVPTDNDVIFRDHKRDRVIIDPTTKKRLMTPIAEIIDNLIDMAHRYDFTLEDAGTAVMEKNNGRESRGYKKEVK
ncbi:MAG: hypothetical protein NTX91_01290 [candidate division SR1 bacterium]|nr:hypothetical protein [candidate division SR1 bacterium]